MLIATFVEDVLIAFNLMTSGSIDSFWKASYVASNTITVMWFSNTA